MNTRGSRILLISWIIMSVPAVVSAAPPFPLPSRYPWATVVNNNDRIPGDPLGRTFNSYNQPSVNVRGLVVIRARSRGGRGAQPTHGIYIRDMSLSDVATNPIIRILDRSTQVPVPNNLDESFVETPAFPRIDMWSDTIATRGNHPPVWEYTVGVDPDTGEPITTRAGTSGVYTNPFGDLITGASKLGAVPDFQFFAVPGVEPPTMFDVFPGAPSVTARNTLAFKGNYTTAGLGRTGVFYRQLTDNPIVLASDGRQLAPAGGMAPVVLIANNTDTPIPGTDEVFGSTSPPSAAGASVVFSGFDNEDAPTLGGIYLAPLAPAPELTTLVRIGERVPGERSGGTFHKLGEGLAFDGRFVGFWGAWGEATRTVRLYCPTEGNQDRIAYCNRSLVCEDTGETLGDPNSICDGTGCFQDKEVPVNQGIFVHDVRNARTYKTASTGLRFRNFRFWTYSGKPPCTSAAGHGEEDGGDDGEPARWRSSAFVAVSGITTAFKAQTDDAVGIYLSRGRGQNAFTVIDTNTDGSSVDPEAPTGSLVTEVGLEREGLRGHWLAVAASMGVEGGTEEEGLAGVYITRVPR